MARSPEVSVVLTPPILPSLLPPLSPRRLFNEFTETPTTKQYNDIVINKNEEASDSKHIPEARTGSVLPAFSSFPSAYGMALHTVPYEDEAPHAYTASGTPSFAKVHQLKMFELKSPIRLQMAAFGSRSTIQYGAHAELKVGDFKQQWYFDVVNLDWYQVILGTLFLKEHKTMLNYAGSGSFKLGDRWFLVKEGDFGSPLSRKVDVAESAQRWA